MKKYILQIETATFDGSVALSENGHTLQRRWLGDGEKHIGTLAPAVQELLHEFELKPANLNAIAVSEGPGSYTGLRIGVSFAKGLATALSIPIMSIPTLQIIAYAIGQKYPFVTNAVALLDARRMEVYTATYSNGSVKSQTEPMVIDANSFAYLRGEKTVFAGNGCPKCIGILEDENWQFDTELKLDAGVMSEIAYKKFKNGQFVDTIHFEPFYLKEFAVGKASNKILDILKG